MLASLTRTAVVISGLIPVSACVASNKSAGHDIWCSTYQAERPSEWESISGNKIHIVDEHDLAAALSMLEEQTFVRIEGDELARFAPMTSRRSQDKYYLVRAGVYSGPDASIGDIHNVAKGALIAAEWNSRERTMVVSTFQMWRGDRKAYNIAAVINTNLPIEDMKVFCQTIE